MLRRLLECLGRDRTKHQVAEVTSLGLVQMTRKRVGQGLLEAFSEPCEHCNGRGLHIHLEPVEPTAESADGSGDGAGAGRPPSAQARQGCRRAGQTRRGRPADLASADRYDVAPAESPAGGGR